MNNSVKLPIWFWVVAVILVIWNLMGVSAFFQHIMLSEDAIAAMTIEEQALYELYPMWTKIVFALAVLLGLAASIALIIRKKIARLLFILSLVFIIIQMVHSLFIAGALEVYGTEAAIMPSIVLLIGVLSVYLSKVCENRGWLN